MAVSLKNSRLVRLMGTDSGITLACIPHAGAGISGFRYLQNALGNTLQLACIQLPGREDRIGESLTQTWHEVASEIAYELFHLNSRQLYIFGHSMGASLAWAVSEILWWQYQCRPTVILSAQSPEFQSRRSSMMSMGLQHWFTLMGEEYPVSFNCPEASELFQATLEQDLAWMEQELKNAPVRTCPLPLHCAYACNDGLVQRCDLEKWKKLTTASFLLSEIEGGHLYPLCAPDKTVRFLKKVINTE